MTGERENNLPMRNLKRDISWQPYRALSRYPHMSPEDTQVWNSFIKSYPDYFDRCAYDLRVGRGTEPSPSLSPEYQKMVTDLSQKRIDVVAMKRQYVTIIEVKKYAALSACGQILVYRYLFRSDFPDYINPHMLIVYNQLDPDIVDFCAAHHILLARV